MRRALSDPRGIALPLSLMVLMLLSPLALLLLSMSALEPLISRNLVVAEQAQFVAEAGIEWTFNTLRVSLDWDALLAGADPKRGAVLIADSPIPGQPASAGTYTVRVRNDSLAGDQLVTGLPLDGGGPTDDTNSLLIVTAAGNVGHASRALQAVFRRIELPPIPAALAFPGENATVDASGSFEIDGHDRTPQGAPGSCAPVFGISVASGANEATVERAMDGHAAGRVKGKRQDPAGAGSGANTIAPAAVLTPPRLQSFLADAQKADLVLAPGGPGALAFSDIGSACAASWSSAGCWGTRDRPKVIYIKGNPDPASAALRVQISGNTEGHGILIVEDGELSISGNFLWHGLIIVTGSRGAASFLGGDSQSVYGALVFNQTALGPDPGSGVSIANARLRYSCQALDSARQARKLLVVRSWREVAE